MIKINTKNFCFTNLKRFGKKFQQEVLNELEVEEPCRYWSFCDVGEVFIGFHTDKNYTLKL